jgi:rhodanese-related sulfurtransferase
MRQSINHSAHTPARPSRQRALTLGALALTLVVSLGTAGCSDSAKPSTSGSAAAAAPAAGATLDPAAFGAAASRPGTVLLDVRTPAEFASGHLPGAINVDVESADFAARIATLDPAVPYAVYCRSGNRSGVALGLMQAAGFTSIYHLGGGITAWQSAGGEVVTG